MGTEFQSIDKILDRLDFYCGEQNLKAEIAILGGSAIKIMLHILDRGEFRPTKDIDIEPLNATDMKGFRELLAKLNIHLVGGVMEVPPL